jgi:hypothetical protein
MNFDVVNLNPRVWGSHAWFFLDSIVLSIDNTNLKDYKVFFTSLAKVLPCGKCRIHYAQYLERYPLDDVKDKDEMMIWLNNLHNQVRVRNNQKPRNIACVLQYYNNQYNTSNIGTICCMMIAILSFLIIFVWQWKR